MSNIEIILIMFLFLKLLLLPTSLYYSSRLS